MRVEGITDSSASQLAGHAFEQHASVRDISSRRTASPVRSAPAEEILVDVVDIRDRTGAPTPRQEVEFTVPRRLAPMGGEPMGIIDRNGNGTIDLGDLPFDYFQISRQASRKLITPPVEDIPL